MTLILFILVRRDYLWLLCLETFIVLLSYLDRLGASGHMLLSVISFIMSLLNVVLLLELA